MAVKCSALFLLLIQAGRVSSCVFDKVEYMSGVAVLDYKNMDKNECFAWCYNNKSCIAIAYDDRDPNKGVCVLFGSGNTPYKCVKDTCHILQRDEVDLTCQTYLNI